MKFITANSVHLFIPKINYLLKHSIEEKSYNRKKILIKNTKRTVIHEMYTNVIRNVCSNTKNTLKQVLSK